MFGGKFFQEIFVCKKSYLAKICLSKKNFWPQIFFAIFWVNYFFSKKNVWQKFSFSWFFLFFAKYLFFFKRFYGEIFLRQKNRLANFFWQQFYFWLNFCWAKYFWQFFSNFTVTVGICSRLSQELTFKVWSNSGQ